MLHIDRTAEELEAVVRAHVGLQVLDLGAVAHAVERHAVGLVLLVEGEARVLEADVAQHARIVGIVRASVGGVADLGEYARTGIRVGAAADVDTAPGARLLQLAGHHDRRRGRAFGVDFGILLDEDVVHLAVIDSHDLDTLGDVKRSSGLNVQAAAQLVGGTLEQVGVADDIALERRARSDFAAQALGPAAVVIVVVARSCTYRAGNQCRCNEFPIRFHLKTLIK